MCHVACMYMVWDHSFACRCSAIAFLMEKMPLKFVLNHQLFFVMALLYVLLDLINEVSSGTVTVAKKLLRKLLELCNSPLKEEDKAVLGGVQEKSFHLVSRHLVKEVISPNENVRKEVSGCGGQLVSKETL